MELKQAYDLAWEKAIAYMTARDSEKELDLLEEAFNILVPFVDEADDIYYKILFATIVQSMQDSGKFDLSDDCNEIKITFYMQALRWFSNTDSWEDRFTIPLRLAFYNLGVILLKGDEVPQNDNVAHICFSKCKMLGDTSVDAILDAFEVDGTGKYIFFGNRPE